MSQTRIRFKRGTAILDSARLVKHTVSQIRPIISSVCVQHVDGVTVIVHQPCTHS